jgi:hypothetical protein
MGGGAGMSGDPRAVNMKGEKFDVLALGTHSLLSIAPKSSTDAPLLALKGSVTRADRCTHTYLRNITLTGAWVSGTEFNEVGVRAVQGVKTPKQLEIGFDGVWKPAGQSSAKSIVTKVSEEAVTIATNGLTMNIDISHGHHMTNWLNLNVEGAEALSKKFEVSGLLGNDDHTQASAMPEDCKKHFKLVAKSCARPMQLMSKISV